MKKIPMQLTEIEQQLASLMTVLKLEDYAVGLELTTNARIRTLNREHRHIDKATDILSFPALKFEKPGKQPIDPVLAELGVRESLCQETESEYANVSLSKDLGDMVIGVPYVAAQAKKDNVPFQARLPVLLAHGLLHLLGYDHEDDKDYRQMRSKEYRVLRQFRQLHPQWTAAKERRPAAPVANL